MKALTFRVWVSDETDTAAMNGSGVELTALGAFLTTLDQNTSAHQLTDEEIANIANGNAQREYYATVQSFVTDLKDEIEAGNVTDSEGAREYLEESIDGCHDVIYTYAAQEVLRQSKNDGAYFDDFGTEGAITDGGIEWSKLAYCALLADVMEEIGDLDDLFTEDDDDEDDDSEETEESL